MSAPPAGTERLYHVDAFLRVFEARVVAVDAAARTLILDRTAFYPEAGGQLADHGTIARAGGAPPGAGAATLFVHDVQVGDDERVVHHLGPDGALPEVGDAVRGTLDFARRRVHMSLHTAQHMLSRALLDACGAATVSARLGETACTIDLDVPALEEAGLARAEAAVNAAIDDDRPVRAFFPTPEELAALALRRAPKVATGVRVIAIDDFDVTPCGGTHCARTSQIGLVSVDGIERYKGKTRVSFLAGGRARAELAARSKLLAGLARELSTAPAEIPVVMGKLRGEITAQREALGALRGELATRLADELARAAADAGALLVAEVPFSSIELVRSIGARVAAATGRAVALLGERDEDGRAVIVTRPAAAPADALACGPALKRAAQALGGRGGGRPEHAEGRMPATVDAAALREALRPG